MGLSRRTFLYAATLVVFAGVVGVDVWIVASTYPLTRQGAPLAYDAHYCAAADLCATVIAWLVLASLLGVNLANDPNDTEPVLFGGLTLLKLAVLVWAAVVAVLGDAHFGDAFKVYAAISAVQAAFMGYIAGVFYYRNIDNTVHPLEGV